MPRNVSSPTEKNSEISSQSEIKTKKVLVFADKIIFKLF